MSDLLVRLNAVVEKHKHEVELESYKVELASIDKFRADYNKIQSSNTTKYIQQLQSIRTNILKGIEQVGNYNDKLKTIISQLNTLGLTDEIKDFQFLKNDVQNDFDELVFISDKLKSIVA